MVRKSALHTEGSWFESKVSQLKNQIIKKMQSFKYYY